MPGLTGDLIPSDSPSDGVLADIVGERIRQDHEHGGGGHDDTHTADEWCQMVTRHNERAISAAATAVWHDGGKLGAEARAQWRHQMVRVAALAVAAIESHDRLAAS